MGPPCFRKPRFARLFSFWVCGSRISPMVRRYKYSAASLARLWSPSDGHYCQNPCRQLEGLHPQDRMADQRQNLPHQTRRRGLVTTYRRQWCAACISNAAGLSDWHSKMRCSDICAKSAIPKSPPRRRPRRPRLSS